jgi:phage anti-repressor protein
MDELVNVTEQGDKQLVNARDLHEASGSKQQFADWIKNRVVGAKFKEGRDYIISAGESTKAGGRPTKEYYLSIPVAQYLAVAEGTAMSEKLWEYLIAVGEAWNMPEAVVHRAVQLSETEIRGWEQAIENLNKADKALYKELEKKTVSGKPSKNLAHIAREFQLAVSDAKLLNSIVAIRYDATQRAIGVLQDHYGLSTADVRRMVFDVRQKIGNKWRDIRGYLEREKTEAPALPGGGQKQLTT